MLNKTHQNVYVNCESKYAADDLKTYIQDYYFLMYKFIQLTITQIMRNFFTYNLETCFKYLFSMKYSPQIIWGIFADKRS